MKSYQGETKASECRGVVVSCWSCCRADVVRSIMDARRDGWEGFSRLSSGLIGCCPECKVTDERNQDEGR